MYQEPHAIQKSNVVIKIMKFHYGELNSQSKSCLNEQRAPCSKASTPEYEIVL